MKRISALGLCLIMACVIPVVATPRTLAELPRQKKVLVAGKPMTVRYLLYLPQRYARETRKRWPLILFLHGSTEKGDDLQIVKRAGLPAYLEQVRSFPFVVISPQLPQDQDRWDPVEMKALLDAVLPDLRVDRDRMYLTGWSLGGNGVWRMATRYPNLFAAIAPVAGWGDADDAKTLKNLPVWAFHGARDTNVLPSESFDMVKALRRQGGDARLTLYPDLDHDCWVTVYRSAKLYDWFLQHHRLRAPGRRAAPHRQASQHP
jgi:predicted peptidase